MDLYKNFLKEVIDKHRTYYTSSTAKLNSNRLSATNSNGHKVYNENITNNYTAIREIETRIDVVMNDYENTMSLKKAMESTAHYRNEQDNMIPYIISKFSTFNYKETQENKPTSSVVIRSRFGMSNTINAGKNSLVFKSNLNKKLSQMSNNRYPENMGNNRNVNLGKDSPLKIVENFDDIIEEDENKINFNSRTNEKRQTKVKKTNDSGEFSPKQSQMFRKSSLFRTSEDIKKPMLSTNMLIDLQTTEEKSTKNNNIACENNEEILQTNVNSNVATNFMTNGPTSIEIDKDENFESKRRIVHPRQQKGKAKVYFKSAHSNFDKKMTALFPPEKLETIIGNLQNNTEQVAANEDEYNPFALRNFPNRKNCIITFLILVLPFVNFMNDNYFLKLVPETNLEDYENLKSGIFSYDKELMNHSNNFRDIKHLKKVFHEVNFEKILPEHVGTGRLKYKRYIENCRDRTDKVIIKICDKAKHHYI